jgi:hypothetical protein
MRRAILLVIAAAVATTAAAALFPASVAHQCYRSDGGPPVPGEYAAGTSLQLTNWVLYADDMGITTQDLSGLTVTVAVGDPDNAVVVTGRVDDAELGLVSALITVPTNATYPAQFVEITITDTNAGVSYAYPPYLLKIRPRVSP